MTGSVNDVTGRATVSDTALLSRSCFLRLLSTHLSILIISHGETGRAWFTTIWTHLGQGHGDVPQLGASRPMELFIAGESVVGPTASSDQQSPSGNSGISDTRPP